MNQISNAARPDLRATEHAWSAPAAPSRQYDKDGNPATVVVAFPHAARADSPARAEPRRGAPNMDIPRSDLADYDDGNPGTVIA